MFPFGTGLLGFEPRRCRNFPGVRRSEGQFVLSPYHARSPLAHYHSVIALLVRAYWLLRLIFVVFKFLSKKHRSAMMWKLNYPL